MSYILLFATGFLLSRLSVRYCLVEQSFAWLLKSRSDSFLRFLLYLALASAVVSMFIPNFITVLTLLPMLEALRRSFEKNYPHKTARRLTTAMVLIVIYGSNIGGMGSLVGSPANALLLGALEVLDVAGREKINFLSWFGWSLPLVAALILMAWAQVGYFIVPSRERDRGLDIPQLQPSKIEPARRRLAWEATGMWFFFWLAHSVLQLLFPSSGHALSLLAVKLNWTRWDTLAALFSLIYITYLFAPLFWRDEKDRRRLLKLSDCYSQLPLRGFIFVLAVLGISSLLITIDAPEWLADRLIGIVPRTAPSVIFYFFISLITTFLTEFFSNTTVSVVLFPLVHSLAAGLGLDPLAALMAVGLASTNAFMLPIATPVNALAYGGVKHVSLPVMIASGFLLNIVSSVWIALVLASVVPWYYGV